MPTPTPIKNKTVFLTQMAMLTVIEIIFCFTIIGSIPIAGAIVATTAHLPAIVAALFFGKKAGLYMGGVMAVCSLIWWTTFGAALPSAFMFIPWAADGRGNIFSLIICIVPRVVFPFVVAWLFEKITNKFPNKRKIAGGISGFIGTAIHSTLVLGGAYLAFRWNAKMDYLYLLTIIYWAIFGAVCEITLGAIVGALAVSKIGIRKKPIGFNP